MFVQLAKVNGTNIDSCNLISWQWHFIQNLLYILICSLVLSMTSTPSEDPTPPPSPVMEYSFGGKSLSGRASRLPKRFSSLSHGQPAPHPPRSSTFACLQRQTADDTRCTNSLSLECRRIAGGLRHFPAQAMAIVGVSPTGEPWNSPPHTPSPVAAAEEEEEAGSSDDGEGCAVPLLGRLPG